MKRFILPIAIIVVLLLGVAVGVYLVRRNQEIRTQASPASTLQLVSRNSTPTEDESFTVDAKITTNDNHIIVADMQLLFDPDQIEVVSAAPGEFIPNPTIIGPTIDNANGSVLYNLKVPTGQSPKQGNGTVATFTFKAKSSGITSISFGELTVFGASSESENVLVSKNSTTITVQQSDESKASSFGQDSEELTGVGGAGLTSPLPTTTATPSATPKSTASATPITELPDTAEITPTLILGGFGAVMLVAGALLFAI